VLFADTVRLRREELRLSQRQVAMHSRVSQQTVSRWEQGSDVPHAGRVAKLAEVLQMRPADLLRLAGYLPPEERSQSAEQFHELFALVPHLSTAELILLVDAGWQVLRERQGFAAPPPLEE
jgi:transcriptional regulator with XRE-family HTH domain